MKPPNCDLYKIYMTILADPLSPTKQVPECGKYSLLGRNTRPREGSELRGLPEVSPFHAATVLESVSKVMKHEPSDARAA